jgi:hypothetical protein
LAQLIAVLDTPKTWRAPLIDLRKITRLRVVKQSPTVTLMDTPPE